MRKKPDIDQFKPIKDPASFLEGGAADAADRKEIPQQLNFTTPQTIAVAKVHREQKIFRLPLDLIFELKRESYERSVKTGSRVTETDLVEQALRTFFNR